MKIRCGVGSVNQAKVEAVAAVFSGEKYDIQGFAVDSTVSDQPFSDEETKEGAVSRSKAVLKKDVEIGIGLEGGVMQMKDGLYLCNWGAIADQKNHLFTAAGAKILLPEEVAAGLHNGEELKTVMDAYTNRHGVSHEEGAVGVFTNGAVTRTDMFTHTVRLLYGQWCLYLS